MDQARSQRAAFWSPSSARAWLMKSSTFGNGSLESIMPSTTPWYSPRSALLCRGTVTSKQLSHIAPRVWGPPNAGRGVAGSGFARWLGRSAPNLAPEGRCENTLTEIRGKNAGRSGTHLRPGGLRAGAGYRPAERARASSVRFCRRKGEGPPTRGGPSSGAIRSEKQFDTAEWDVAPALLLTGARSEFRQAAHTLHAPRRRSRGGGNGRPPSGPAPPASRKACDSVGPPPFSGPLIEARLSAL